MAEEPLIQKIRSLPPERVAEVEDFVDFLTVRDQDRHFTQAATRWLAGLAVRSTPVDPDAGATQPGEIKARNQETSE